MVVGQGRFEGVQRRMIMENKISEIWLDEWIVSSGKFEELLNSDY